MAQSKKNVKAVKDTNAAAAASLDGKTQHWNFSIF